MTEQATDRLFDTLAGFFPIPAALRRADTDPVAARQLLGCDEDTLAELVRRGLPATRDGARLRFDQRDLFNLALHTGSGRTPPELAFRYALRWMSLPTDELTRARTWTFTADVDCRAPRYCDGDPGSALAVPAPQLYGGEIRLPGHIEADAAGRLRSSGQTLRLQAEIRVAGEFTEIRSARVREIYAGFLARSLRWSKLPAAIQAEVDTLLPRGIATCVTASLYLERQCQAAGLTARTRRGWVLGMLDLVHAWVEVVDTDGTIKILDPIFGLFSSMLPDSNPLLDRPDISARTNRLLPTALSAAQPLATHGCRGTVSEPSVEAVILPVSPDSAPAELRREKP
ncbi:hypothetical protein [Nocardia sp. NPDC057030]|uniref:hypothetical protein n=1 Tax=unclassified Nocardia TaxID=2637762 RepID=UPI003636C4BB